MRRRGLRCDVPALRRRALQIPSPNLSPLDAIRDDFAVLDDWEDRYRYILELGRALEPLSDAERSEVNKVRGCVSQVWIVQDGASTNGFADPLHFRGDSDSHLVRGLVAVALALFNDRGAEQILATDALAVFRELGLESHLTPQRSNGVRSMVERIRADARARLAPT